MLAALLLALAAPPSDATLDELTRAFQQSCGSRLYGQYDDVCERLQIQISRYEAELRRKPAPHGAPAPPPSTVPPEVMGATPVTHEPLKGAPPK